jgi:hypothetical protein
MTLTGLMAWALPTSANDPAPPAALASPPAAKTIDPQQDKRLRNMGYRPETRHGELVYCRTETVVGTRFPSKVCGTPADLARITTEGRDAINQIQRSQIVPMGK